MLNAFALKVLQRILQPYAAPEAAAYPAAYKDPKSFWVSLKNTYNSSATARGWLVLRKLPKTGKICCIPAGNKLGMVDEEYFWYGGCSNTGATRKQKIRGSSGQAGNRWRNGHNLLIELWAQASIRFHVRWFRSRHSVVIYLERAEQFKARGQTVEW